MLIPKLTADQWSLYTKTKDCEDAATSLNNGLCEAFVYLDQDTLSITIPERVANAMRYYHEAAKNFGRFGANDSEPRDEFYSQLIHHLATKLGLDEGNLYSQCANSKW